jgi:hypothetical protein
MRKDEEVSRRSFLKKSALSTLAVAEGNTLTGCAEPEKRYSTQCVYRGEIWKSHWWVAEFRDIDEEGE